MTEFDYLARMKRRFLLYATLILAAGTAINGVLYAQVQEQSRENCERLTELVDFTKGSYVDLADRIRVIPEGERNAAAGAQLDTLNERLAVLETIQCGGK